MPRLPRKGPPQQLSVHRLLRLELRLPRTGLCINPVTYDWLRCSFSTPGFTKAARGVAMEDVSRLPFVARRIQDGRLEPELAEEEWNNHVGDDHYADEGLSSSTDSR